MAVDWILVLSLHRVDFIAFILLTILFTTKLLSLVNAVSWDILGILGIFCVSNSIRISFISFTLTSRTSGRQSTPFNLIPIYSSLQFYNVLHIRSYACHRRLPVPRWLVFFSPTLPCGFLLLLLYAASAAASSSSSAASSAIINTTPSTHHQHNTINTTPSTQHHQQHHLHDAINNIIYTTPSTQHQHNTINTTSSARHHQHNTIQHTIINTSSSSSTQHHPHNIIYTTSSTQQHHQHNTIYTTSSNTTSSSLIGGHQSHFAWQVQHSEHLSVILRGRSSTWSTSMSFCVAGAALGATPERSAEARRQSGDDWVLWAPAAFAWQVQHLEHLSVILRGRCSTRNTIYTTSSTRNHPTQAHQHITIYITPSTQHHLHNTIYTTSSTQHHLHYIIHTTPSTLHHHILAGAALGALPSYPFCLIPADTPLVILRCCFFFVLFPQPVPHLDVRRHC